MARQGWTLRGRIAVRHVIPELGDTYGAVSPLSGMRVRIEARERIAGVWGSWNKWQDILLRDEDGRFEASKIKSDNRRRFRVKLLFKNSDLVIYGANRTLMRQASRLLRMAVLGGPVKELLVDQVLQHFTRLPYQPDWHILHVDRMRNGRRAGVIDLGDLVFEAGGANDLGDRIARRQADIWFLYRKVMALLAGFGPEFAFRKKVAVKYPHNNPLLADDIEVSYANPINHLVYMVENSVHDDYEIAYLLHELMHIWTYQNSRREKGMAWQLIVHGDTHNMQERTWVAFHEGFAEYCYRELYRELFGRNPTAVGGATEFLALPYSRAQLRRYGIDTIEDVDHHENGWMSLLHLLSTPRITGFTFNGNGQYVTRARFRPDPRAVCDDPSMSFAGVLRLCLSDSADGSPRQLRRSEMTLERFLDRAEAVAPGFDGTARAAVLSLLDPAAATQPRDLLCRRRR